MTLHRGQGAAPGSACILASAHKAMQGKQKMWAQGSSTARSVAGSARQTAQRGTGASSASATAFASFGVSGAAVAVASPRRYLAVRAATRGSCSRAHTPSAPSWEGEGGAGGANTGNGTKEGEVVADWVKAGRKDGRDRRRRLRGRGEGERGGGERGRCGRRPRMIESPRAKAVPKARNSRVQRLACGSLYKLKAFCHQCTVNQLLSKLKLQTIVDKFRRRHT